VAFHAINARRLHLAPLVYTLVRPSVMSGRGFFEKQKLTGPNFINWYRQLRIVLSIEDKLNYLEQPIPPAPVAPAGQHVAPEILATHNAWNKGSKEIQPEQELLQTMRDFDSCRQEEGQSVNSYVLKMKGYIDNLERLGHPVTLGLGVRHWKRNYPQYLAELLKKKKNATSGAGGSGIFVIELNTILDRSWIYDTGCSTHICNTTHGLRASRKLKPGALSLYVGNGQREAVETIGVFYLCLPSALEIVLNNCHYAPSITRGVISVFRLYEDGFVNRFANNTIQVSRNNMVYFSAIPRDERRNRTLLDMVRSMMSQTTLPKSFWDYALETAARILNMVPTKKVEKTPYEVWHGSINCIVIGYPKETMRYFFYYPPENKVLVAQNAEFLENSLINQEAGGSLEDLEIIQEQDTHPSIDTSLNHEEDDLEIDEPQSDIVPIRRSTRTRHAPDRMCLYIDAEEHELGDLGEPVNYKAALLDHKSDKWLNAMNVEMQSMKDNEVWVLVELPPNGKTVGSKWIFKKKTDMDGVVHTYKDRLMAKGYTQTPGIDYEETFSPVADIRAIRILIAIATYYDYEICVKTYLGRCFAMTDLGEAAYILGIKIYRDRSRRLIGLCQSAYIKKILKQYCMKNSKRGSIPMQEKLKLSESQGASTPAELKRMQNVPYASVVGSILYAVRCTRPDVAFAQNVTSRFQQNLGDLHWTTVKNILKYLRNTNDMFLVYGGDLKQELRVSCYTDAGYLTDADDLKSQTGYVFILNGGAVDWKNAKQSIFATSSAEAEYIAAFDAFKEAVWVRKFISGLGVVPTIEESISMYCDNTGVIAIANESGITKGARHFRTKVHYLREVIEYGDIKLEKVHTVDNLADPFTKALAFPKHSEHTRNIGMLPASSLMLEDGELKDATFLCDRPNPTFAVLYKVNEEDCLLKTYTATVLDENILVSPLAEFSRGSRMKVEPGFLIRVPTPLCGLLILGESRVFYCSNTNVVSVPVTCSFSGAYAAESSSSYFLGDQSGALHYLCLEVVGKKVEISIDMVGVTSVASTISCLGNSRIYVGSRYGDSQLATYKEDKYGVSVLEAFVNLGPIADFNIVELETDQGKIVCCSNDSCIWTFTNGACINETLQFVVGGIIGIWALKPSVDDTFHRLLVLSCVDEGGRFHTCTFVLENSFPMTNDLFLDEDKTLFCHCAQKDILLQVCSSLVRIVSFKEKSQISRWEWTWATSINIATTDSRLVLLATRDHHLMLCSLKDGLVLHFDVNGSSGELSNPEKVLIGSKPPKLLRSTLKNKDCVFAACDRPTIIHRDRDKFLYTPVQLTDVSFFAPVVAEGMPDIVKAGKLELVVRLFQMAMFYLQWFKGKLLAAVVCNHKAMLSMLAIWPTQWLFLTQDDSLKKVSYDPSCKWMSALCTIGDEFCIGAENRGELFLVSKKYLSDDVDEQSCRKMHVIGGVHMGRW
nr:retrotransposon protein, putative, Ty1-copia subclass [Tanacetum cinerariifolium]